MDSIEPWSEPVDGSELIDLIAATIRRYVHLSVDATLVAALYAVFTHCLSHDPKTSAFDIAPRLYLTSVVKGCGKTTLLKILIRICSRPKTSSNESPATLFRSIDQGPPTLALDESDNWASQKTGPLLGILNSGHDRASATISRVVGGEVREFCTFCAIILAAKGRVLAATLEDRALTLLMEKTLPEEEAKLEKFRLDRTDHLTVVRRKAMRWARDNMPALRACDPVVPDSLNFRAADNARPLLAIAEIAQGGLPELARAAVEIIHADLPEPDEETEIIADCCWAFAKANVIKMRSADLCRKLPSRNPRYAGMTQKGLSLRLKPFRITTETKRFGINNNVVQRGYMRSQFDDAVARYRIELDEPRRRCAVQSHPQRNCYNCYNRYRLGRCLHDGSAACRGALSRCRTRNRGRTRASSGRGRAATTANPLSRL